MSVLPYRAETWRSLEKDIKSKGMIWQQLGDTAKDRVRWCQVIDGLFSRRRDGPYSYFGFLYGS
jgi:hypothetical protein